MLFQVNQCKKNKECSCLFLNLALALLFIVSFIRYGLANTAIEQKDTIVKISFAQPYSVHLNTNNRHSEASPVFAAAALPSKRVTSMRAFLETPLDDLELTGQGLVQLIKDIGNDNLQRRKAEKPLVHLLKGLAGVDPVGFVNPDALFAYQSQVLACLSSGSANAVKKALQAGHDAGVISIRPNFSNPFDPIIIANHQSVH